MNVTSTRWIAFAVAWLGMLAVTARVDGQHPLLVPGWGLLIGLLGVGMLIDRTRTVRLYQRGMPGGMSVSYVRCLVAFSGVTLALMGVALMTVGFITAGQR